MVQNQRRKWVVPGVIIFAMIICGLVGYINRVDRLGNESEVLFASPTSYVRDLANCPQAGVLCITSVGLDNSQNMLLVLTNTGSSIPAIYMKLQQVGQPAVFACQKIQPIPETFYCLGGPVTVDMQVNLQIFEKKDDRLVANGEFNFQPSAGISAPLATVPVLIGVQSTPSEASSLILIPFQTQPVSYPYPNP